MICKKYRIPEHPECGIRACQKNIFDKLSNETRFAGRSVEGVHPAARIICAPTAHKFHTCRARSIFPDVHAAGENDFDFICACGRKLCEAFLTV